MVYWGKRVLPDFQHNLFAARHFEVTGFHTMKEENTGHLLCFGNVSTPEQLEVLNLCIVVLQFVNTVNVQIIHVIGVVLKHTHITQSIRARPIRKDQRTSRASRAG